MLIEVSHLCKSFGSFKAVQDLSFTVQAGDVYGFLGQNGAGKSTTIRMLLSLIRPTSGTIRIFGRSLQKEREEILENTGAVVERPDLYKYLTGHQHLALFAKLNSKKISDKQIVRTLSVVGLEKRAKDKVGVYSQGMKQRLGIAIALLHDPELIVLDEPTNGLDPQGIADIRNLILSLSKDQGKTIVVSSHLLSEVEQIADSMLVINKGIKVVEGKVRELMNPDRVQLELITTDNQKSMDFLKQSHWAVGLRESADHTIKMEVDPASIPGLSRKLFEQGIDLISLKSINSLEAYFLSITSGNEIE